MLKGLLYFVIVPIVIWILEGTNINSIFKKGRVIQASLFYLVISICLSYVLVNFFWDIFLSTKIV